MELHHLKTMKANMEYVQVIKISVSMSRFENCVNSKKKDPSD